MADSSDWTPRFGTLDRAPLAWAAKRPVRIALLGDFGAGASSGRLQTGAALAQRKPLAVEFDTLEDALARQQLELSLPVGENAAAVEIHLRDLDSFHPDTLYRELGLLRQLADLRKRLNHPASFAKAAAEVQKMAGGARRRASLVARGARSRGATPAPGAKLDDFARLTGRASAPAGPASNLDPLLRDIVSPFVVPAPQPELATLLGTVDGALADVMRALLHHSDFQTAESLWRGVDFLLRRLETGPTLQVHLIDLSAEELAADLSAGDDLAQSGLYGLLAGKPSEAREGGYSFIAGLYQFEATPPHAELLGRMAKIAAAAGAPFITAVATDAFADAHKPPHALVQAAFDALRALPEAGSLALLGPRFLLRLPYGKRSDPITSFAFEEFTAADGLRGMLWGHPALLALTALTGQGGALVVDELPFHHYVDAEGDSTALPCTDRFVSAGLATHLGRYGISALMAHRGDACVRLAGLDAINGQPLSASNAARSGARAGIQVQVQAKAVAHRKPAAAPDAASRANTSVDSAIDAAPTGGDSTAGGSDELSRLLADMGDGGSGDSAGATDSSADSADASDGSSVDSDLDALLKSLG